MKFKKLKEIDIIGHTFKIVWEPKKFGGSFDFDGWVMKIGCGDIKENNPQITWQILMHEISEIVHAILNTRYVDRGTSEDYKFFMSHKEFQNHNTILSSIMWKFI